MDWITVLTLSFTTEAHMVKGLLQSADIEVFLKDELTAQVNPYYSSAIGGVKVQVMEKDLKNALLILHDAGYIKPEEQNEVGNIPKNQIINKCKCPYCQSNNISKKRNVDILTLIFSAIFGFFFPIFRLNGVCFDCGKEWRVI